MNTVIFITYCFSLFVWLLKSSTKQPTSTNYLTLYLCNCVLLLWKLSQILIFFFIGVSKQTFCSLASYLKRFRNQVCISAQACIDSHKYILILADNFITLEKILVFFLKKTSYTHILKTAQGSLSLQNEHQTRSQKKQVLVLSLPLTECCLTNHSFCLFEKLNLSAKPTWALIFMRLSSVVEMRKFVNQAPTWQPTAHSLWIKS